MPTIDDVLRREARLPKLQKAVLDYFESHPDEVFSWNHNDLSDLASRLKMGKPASIGWSFWALHKKGHVHREKVGRRYYYGSQKALTRLRAARNGKSGRT